MECTSWWLQYRLSVARMEELIREADDYRAAAPEVVGARPGQAARWRTIRKARAQTPSVPGAPRIAAR